MVSTFRLNPETYGLPADDQLWLDRIVKLSVGTVEVTYSQLDFLDERLSVFGEHLVSLDRIDGFDLPQEVSLPD